MAYAPDSEALFFLGHQNLALSGVIGLTDDAFLFHAFHQRCGAVVADLQAALDVARGSLAVAFDDGHGLREQIAAALATTHAGRIEHRAVLLARLFRRDGLEIFRRALRLEMTHHLLDFLVRCERAVHAAD